VFLYQSVCTADTRWNVTPGHFDLRVVHVGKAHPDPAPKPMMKDLKKEIYIHGD